MKHGKRLWQEDDATPGTDGHETVGDAWERLFGETLITSQAEAREDCGDHDMLRMPNDHVVCLSYPGNNAIYAPEGQP